MTSEKKTKTIYYAFVQKLEISTEATEEEIDDYIFSCILHENGEKPADYIWSEKPNLLWED